MRVGSKKAGTREATPKALALAQHLALLLVVQVPLHCRVLVVKYPLTRIILLDLRLALVYQRGYNSTTGGSY